MQNGERKFANTTSSLYIDSTISKPNADAIIAAVSTILHSQIQEVRDFTIFRTSKDKNSLFLTPFEAILLYFNLVQDSTLFEP